MQWPLLPDYGFIDRWPRDGVGFLHPQDIPAARYCIPSLRVFRRNHFDGQYYHCSYGHRSFRLRPCLICPVTAEGYDLGDWVETVGLNLRRELFVAQVAQMEYSRRWGCILYQLRRGNTTLEKRYRKTELRPLVDKARIRSKPPEPVIPLPEVGDEYQLRPEEDRR